MIIVENRTLYTVCTCSNLKDLVKIADGDISDSVEYFDGFESLDMAKGFAMGVYCSNSKVKYACIIKDTIQEHTPGGRKYLNSEVIFELINEESAQEAQEDIQPTVDKSNWS